MTFVLRKNDLKEFPFSECALLNDHDLEEWASAHNISGFNSWMLPQLQAYLSTFKLVKDEEGKYSPKQLYVDNIKGNDWAIGIWRICTKLKRSSLVKTQINPLYSEYSALVPLLLSGLKKSRGIGYNDWHKEGLENLISADLYEAATYDYKDNLTTERLQELRVMGLTTKSGPNAGQIKKATSSWCLTGLKGTEAEHYPKLLTTMLAQIWVADPSIRNNLMILDPLDWDNMPPALFSTAVVKSAPAALVGTGVEPW